MVTHFCVFSMLQYMDPSMCCRSREAQGYLFFIVFKQFMRFLTKSGFRTGNIDLQKGLLKHKINLD